VHVGRRRSHTAAAIVRTGVEKDVHACKETCMGVGKGVHAYKRARQGHAWLEGECARMRGGRARMWEGRACVWRGRVRLRGGVHGMKGAHKGS
jgi:hypothetical protein